MNLALRTRLETKDSRKEDDEDRNPADEIKEALDERNNAITKRFDDLEKKLAAEKDRADRLETVMKRSPKSEPGDRKAEPTLEEKAFNEFLRRGPDALQSDERKALTVGDSTTGGYLVTGQFDREILKNLVEISPVRQAVRVGSMTSSDITIPKRTARPTAWWVGETEDRSATQQAYGQVTISAHEAACYIDVSNKLLEDAAIPIEQEISADLAEEFARIEGVSFTVGDGVGKPHGFLLNADVPQIASGHATQITPDALINLLYSLPEFYRAQSTWMMNGSTLAAIRKLKDTTNQYLWQPGIAAGQPSTILGRPVIEAADMPIVAAGTFPIALGAFKQAYRIYDRTGMSLLRDPFTMATKGLVRFHARRRVGADVVKAEALRKLKVAESI